MCKYYIFILCTWYSIPAYSMDVFGTLQDFVRSWDYTADEETRGFAGSFLRRVLKDSGAMDADLIGLGNERERERTLGIVDHLKDSPGDAAVLKQFVERQAKVTHFAGDLIAQLEDFDRRCERQATRTGTSSAQVDITKESPGLFKLIKMSLQLRRLHQVTTLSPMHSIRLKKATNSVRRHIKQKLQLTDRSHTNDSPDEATILLREEPEVDEQTVDTVLQSAPPQKVINQVIIFLRQALQARSSRAGGAARLITPENEQIDPELISLAMNLASSKDVIAHARAIADADGKELKLVAKTQDGGKK